MFFKLFVVCLLASARAAPQDVLVVSEAPVAVAVEEPVVPVAEPVVPVAEAVVPVVEAVAPAAVVPVATPVERAINTCRTELEPLETQTCTPRHERVCQPLEVVNQKIGYEKKCKDVVSIQCPQAVAPIGGTVLVKREADAAAHYYAPFAPFQAGPIHHPVAFRQTCQEVTTQHCIDSPIVLDEPAVAESCHVVTKVDCVPVLEQIPKTICDPVETIVPGNLAPVNPLAYHHGLLFGR